MQYVCAVVFVSIGIFIEKLFISVISGSRKNACFQLLQKKKTMCRDIESFCPHAFYVYITSNMEHNE